jgi:glycosyltransferase involved in cell wall biosynthesis
VLANRELAQRLGAGGRLRAEREFSIETCAAAYDALYRRVVAARAEPSR